MKVSCPSCQTNYNIDDKRIPAGGAKLKCAKCQTTFPISLSAGSVPLPGGTPQPDSVPLPGTGFGEGAVPLPSNGGSGTRMMGAVALPSPGGGAGTGTRMMGAVPLPSPGGSQTRMMGAVAPPSFGDSIPLPGSGQPAYAAGPSDSAVALPGGGYGHPNAVPLPGMAVRSGAIPMPGSGRAPSPEPDAAGFEIGEGDSVPLPGAPTDGWQAQDSVALPGNGYAPPEDFGSMEQTSAPPEPAIPMPSPVPPPAMADDIGFADADLMDAPPPPPMDYGEVAPPEPPSFDFAEPQAPPPPESAPPGFDFSEDVAAAPPPPAPVDDFSFEPPPPPAQAEAAVDFAEPPPPEPPAEDSGGSLDFGDPLPPPPEASEVDFGAPPPPPDAPEPSMDFAPPPPEPAGDFSLPEMSNAPAPQGENLEMLSFIDDGGSKAAASQTPQFQVRRKSGKVFGPFDEAVVIKMLQDGQLQGNEEVSTDGDNWTPLSEVPAFAGTEQSPASDGGVTEEAAQAPAEENSSGHPTMEQTAASMERLKQLYEGRMAVVSVVQSVDYGAKIKKLLPMAIGGFAIVALLGTGASLSFTRYGAFGLKKIFPASIKQGSTEYAQLEQARQALLADTFKSYGQARDITAKLLTVKEYPEVRAIWCQAVFYLQRRYAAAGGDLPTAMANLEEIQLLGVKNPEVAKALAGAALMNHTPDVAIARLDVPKFSNPDDVELFFLSAEALTQQNKVPQARAELKAVLAKKKNSAKAHHALGSLALRGNEAELAAKEFTAALEADPSHVSSALELAAVELLIRNEPQAGLDAVSKALDDKTRLLLGPAELARAYGLKGVALAKLFKSEEALKEFEEAKKLDPTSVFILGNMGRVYLSAREFDKALPLLKDAALKEPSELGWAEGYLSALIAVGKMQDALNYVKDANARFVGNARIAYLYGRVNDALDVGTDAEGHYKRAINADAKLFEANLFLAKFYLRFNRVAEAKAQLEEAINKAPEDPGVLSGIGELALSESDIGKAQTQFEKAIAANPNFAEAHLGLSKVLLAQGHFPEAEKEIDKALELDGAIKGGRLQRGLVLWKLKNLQGSIVELEQAKVADGKNARIQITLGAVKMDANDLPGAEAALASALAFEPFNPDAHFYMARVKSRRLEHSQAIDAMRTALERAPKRPTFHYEMGLVYRAAGKVNEAMDAWRKAIELQPNYADAYESLGVAQLEKSQFDNAIKSFEAALKADSARTRVYGLIGDCYFQASRWEEAIARYQTALKVDPGLKPLIYKIGRAYTESGNHTKAIDYYTRATQAEPANPMPYWYLGFAHKHKGAKKPAVAAFKTYLEKRPDAEDKKDIEEEIFDLEN